jgi:hypothetical protein
VNKGTIRNGSPIDTVSSTTRIKTSYNNHVASPFHLTDSLLDKRFRQTGYEVWAELKLIRVGVSQFKHGDET